MEKNANHPRFQQHQLKGDINLKQKKNHRPVKFSKKGAKITAGLLCAVLAIGAAGGGIAYTIRGKLPDEAPDAAFTEGLAEEEAERRNDGDTRVMSANLLVHYESWGGSNAAPRAQQFIEVLKTFTPDVAGLQEVSGQWFCLLNRNMPEGYRFLHPTATLFGRFTTMIYNENTVRVLDSGSQTYTRGTDARMRRIEWALFERLDTGKQFVVTNTHLDLLHEGSIEEELPILQSEAEELIAFSNELKEQYGCPVFSAGDYNAMEDTPYTKEVDAKEIYALLADSLTDAKTAALRAKSGLAWSLSEPVYDHIFVNGEVTISQYQLLSNSYMNDLSDHYPIFADFSL